MKYYIWIGIFLLFLSTLLLFSSCLVPWYTFEVGGKKYTAGLFSGIADENGDCPCPSEVNTAGIGKNIKVISNIMIASTILCALSIYTASMISGDSMFWLIFTVLLNVTVIALNMTAMIMYGTKIGDKLSGPKRDSGFSLTGVGLGLLVIAIALFFIAQKGAVVTQPGSAEGEINKISSMIQKRVGK